MFIESLFDMSATIGIADHHGTEWHLETEHGNFIWSDGERCGTNTIRPTELNYEELCQYNYFTPRSPRSEHVIGSFTGYTVSLEKA